MNAATIQLKIEITRVSSKQTTWIIYKANRKREGTKENFIKEQFV